MKNNLTYLLLILVSAFVLTSCGESKEAVANDMLDQMKKSTSVMNSGNKDAIAKFEEENNILEKRAKAVGIDLKDPSTYPENLRKAIEDQKSSLLSEAKDTAKGYLDENSDLPESAKKLMKKTIDSADEK